MKTPKIALFAAALLLPTIVFAHGDKAGPNGGVVADVGKYHVELVMKADELRAFVTGAGDAKVDIKGAEASATVLAGKEKRTLRLLPAGGNVLTAAGAFNASTGAKVVLSLALPGQAAVTGRFNIAAKN